MSDFPAPGTTMANHPNRSKKNANVPGRTPKGGEVKAAREAAGLTQGQAADLVFVGARAWQRWESDDPSEGRDMPPAVWQLFRLKLMARGEGAVDALLKIFEELRT